MGNFGGFGTGTQPPFLVNFGTEVWNNKEMVFKFERINIRFHIYVCLASETRKEWDFNMRVILKADIKGVGKKDEIINASDGYARNFLFPKNLAVEANNENMSKLKAKQDSAKFQKNQEKEEAIKTADRLSKVLLKIKVKAGGNGKIFGGVSAKEIAEELDKEYQIKVDKKKIVLNEPIKDLGIRTVEIKLFESVIGKLKINVMAE